MLSPSAILQPNNEIIKELSKSKPKLKVQRKEVQNQITELN